MVDTDILRVARPSFTDVADLLDEVAREGIFGGTSGGSANAHTLNFSPDLSAVSAGDRIRFIAGFTNTTAMTLTVDVQSPVAVTDVYGDALTGGEVVAGGPTTVLHDGTGYLLLRDDIGALKTYTPTYGNGGAGTWQNITTTYAEHMQIGKLQYVRVKAIGDIVTDTVSDFIISTPVTLLNSQGNDGATVHEGSALPVSGSMLVSGTDFLVFRYDKGTVGTGTGNRGMGFKGLFKRG